MNNVPFSIAIIIGSRIKEAMPLSVRILHIDRQHIKYWYSGRSMSCSLRGCNGDTYVQNKRQTRAHGGTTLLCSQAEVFPYFFKYHYNVTR